MERLSLYQAMPTEKLPQSYISWVIKLCEQAPKIVLWNWTVSLDITDNSESPSKLKSIND